MLARSVIDGPLSKLSEACCHTVKVSNALQKEGNYAKNMGTDGKPIRVICIYFDSCWDKGHAKEVVFFLLFDSLLKRFL